MPTCSHSAQRYNLKEQALKAKHQDILCGHITKWSAKVGFVHVRVTSTDAAHGAVGCANSPSAYPAAVDQSVALSLKSPRRRESDAAIPDYSGPAASADVDPLRYQRVPSKTRSDDGLSFRRAIRILILHLDAMNHAWEYRAVNVPPKIACQIRVSTEPGHG